MGGSRVLICMIVCDRVQAVAAFLLNMDDGIFLCVWGKKSACHDAPDVDCDFLAVYIILLKEVGYLLTVLDELRFAGAVHNIS